MRESDYEKMAQIVLDEDALDVAIDRATEANRAGYDDHEIICEALRGYLYSTRLKAGGNVEV